MAAVPLITLSAAGGSLTTAVTMTAAAMAASTAAATAATGAMVGMAALGGAMALGSMASSGDDSAPQSTVERLDPTGEDTLLEEKTKNKNLRRKLYSTEDVLGTGNATDGLSLLGA